MIGDNIEVKVVEIRGGKVKLGFTAPRNVSVHRREIYDRIQREGTDVVKKTAAARCLMLLDRYRRSASIMVVKPS